MAITLKPIEAIADKWSKRAGAASPDYATGVAQPAKDWGRESIAGANAWQQGVNEAVAGGRFARGVAKAGTAKWQAKSTTLGAQRYSSGVSASKGDYSAGFAPFAQVITSVALPEKGARGASGNLERVRAVADALHAKRISGS